MGVAVQVIAVKLYGEASAPGVVDCEVPASPYAQIGTLGLKVDYSFVVLVLTDDFCGSVCRVIVHDDDVEWKACFLCCLLYTSIIGVNAVVTIQVIHIRIFLARSNYHGKHE